MSKMLSSFSPLMGVEHVWIAQTSSLRCTALTLKDGSLCLYSPVSGLSLDALASLKSLGEVSYILASNHYHNKGLVEYGQTFPAAKLICSSKARPRLEKQTGLEFGAFEDLKQSLLPNMMLVEPEGLKTGEIWMSAACDIHRIWIVTDAFRGKGKCNTVSSNDVELLGTFPKFGIGDLSQYAKWLATQVKGDRPDIIVPCHGSVATGLDIASQALSLVQSLEA
jgi:hypothetical protein